MLHAAKSQLGLLIGTCWLKLYQDNGTRSPIKTFLFSVLASLEGTPWTKDLSCSFAKLMLFMKLHFKQQESVANLES